MTHHIDYDPMRGEVTIHDIDLIHAATYGKGLVTNITTTVDGKRPAITVTFLPDTLTIHAPKRTTTEVSNPKPEEWPCHQHATFMSYCLECAHARDLRAQNKPPGTLIHPKDG